VLTLLVGQKTCARCAAW